MSARDKIDSRCDECLMHATLCICSLVPRLVTRTRLALLVHYREVRKPSNTGRLAARCLERSRVEIVGLRDRPLKPLRIEDEVPLLLFPADDAVSIEKYAGSKTPVALVVPDGNWRQASKMRQRGPGLDQLQCVTLPDTGPSRYHLRTELRTGGLATLEAIGRALTILEGDGAVEAAMLAVFRVMVDRTLWHRGKLASDQVTGGVPAEAIAADPRGGC